ncbi:MAG: glycosyltransferase [Betaproteobacteria bacterium]|nr:glycosyltransferase [Betaproteobacteria bacterium]
MASRVLFIHQNFPGQFKHLAPALAARGHDVKALAITGQTLSGIQLIDYKPTRGTSNSIHPWVAEFETKVIRGEACGNAMLALRQQGWHPHLIIAHPGWGESLFAKDIWPSAKMISFLEFYYAAQGTDVGFDPEFARSGFAEDARLRLKNANNLLALEASDWGLSPTDWQRSSLPAFFRDRVSVIFDGINTDIVKPDPNVQLSLGKANASDPSDQHRLRYGDEVITFVNRNLEPYRGYHVMMRALPAVLAARPGARVLIVGGDGVSYGAKPPEGRSWKQIFLQEVEHALDMSRVHFLGNIPYAAYLKLLQLSACHVYLTYPFVLSWSCIEALAAGCVVVGSQTPPVMEAISHDSNGLLVDFFDTQALAQAVITVLENPKAYVSHRQLARKLAIERYDLERVCLPAQLDLVGQWLPKHSAL